MARSTTTCTCSPEIPWYCDTCLALRAHHDQVIAEALAEVRRHKALATFLSDHRHDDRVIGGSDITMCLCEVAEVHSGAQLYSAALAHAKGRVLARALRRAAAA